MKRAFLFSIIIYGLVNVGTSQNIVKHSSKKIKSENIEIIDSNHTSTICGNILFRDNIRNINDYISSHPEYQKSTRRLQKPQSYNVGDTKGWWVQDAADSFLVLPSTCMAVGENCYIFVSDASWTNSEVTQTQIDELVEAFDNSTPSFPTKGIYEVDVDTYGEPPDFDGDNKIIIFLHDIQDDYESTGIAALGYFWAKDQFNDGDPAIGNLRSNEAEIFYVDTHPLLDIFGMNYAKLTLAHEFQHMIHYGHDPNEITFVNEGLSEVAEYICGYGLRSNSWYAENTNRSLLSWDYDDKIPDYSRAALWTLYIYEQFPIEILKDFVDRSHPGWVAFNTTLGSYDPSRNWFFDYIGEWFLANYINDVTVDSKYGYTYTPIVKPSMTYSHVGVLDAALTTDTLQSFAAQYIEFSGGSNLTVTFANVGGTISIKAIKQGDGTATIVEDVTNNPIYTPSGYGTTYNKIVFLLYNSSPDQLASYTYSATGTSISGSMELAYEDGEPEGYLKFATGDSSAVLFSGISGAKLDSIKVAFRRNGRIQMDISELDGQAFIRGTTLYGPVQINSPDSTATVSPYPSPYDNWVKVNLASQNIDATKDFVVSFLIGNNPAEPGIMISSEPDDSERRSRTYYKSADTWYYISDSGTPGNIFKYLIRAYVSIGGGTVAIDQNGIVTIPEEFSLKQNYPNPFNPSTTFRFSTPKDGLVKFTVHDLLGRVVYAENRNLFAGNYSFTWDGQNKLNQQVVSGVYFLRMEAEGFSQTRKMLMMK